MSLGDDHGYGGGGHRRTGDRGERGRGRGGGSTSHTFGEGQTRTRLPEGSDAYGGARRPGRAAPRGQRGLVTVVGIVVLLIAAIAFANRGGGQSETTDEGGKPAVAETSASGKRPVTTTSQGGIPSGFAQDDQGAQSAAANYAVALGSADMFDKAKRDSIVEAIVTPSRIDDFKSTLDKSYSPEFDRAVGLNADGSSPDGYTFVSRTSPIGTKTTHFSGDRASVSVWCGGLLGLAGEDSTTPVTDSWFTITMTLEWTAHDWKIVSNSQKDGPAPVPGDGRASSADEIAKVVEGYGGFTYAR